MISFTRGSNSLGEAEHNRCLRSKRKAEPFESHALRQNENPVDFVDGIFILYETCQD